MNKTVNDKLNDLVVGDFVYCYRLDANVEILAIIDRGDSYDKHSADRHCFCVAGTIAPRDARHWNLPKKDKKTIFHVEIAKNCYAIDYTAVLSDEEFDVILNGYN